MSYNTFIPMTPDLASIALASLNSTKLIDALEDLGYDDIDVLPIEDGFALTISGEQIAIGIGDDALEASENLLDRVADLFYHDTPES
jgi:hypothetical protein|tara:strand:- start:409 stop:669 length:261 start_codon:yes stop_codon:yes gene_type:complete